MNDSVARAVLGLVVVISVPIFKTVYNIWFHPLSSISGPWHWACSPLPFIRSLITDRIVQDVECLHREYGSIIRISPKEAAFSSLEAWNDIFQPGPGRHVFVRDQLWWRKQAGHPDSIISTPRIDDHQRMRKALSSGFTPKALKHQESVIQSYVSLLIDRLYEQVDTRPDGFDIVPWLNFTTFDIFGDLGFGESFDCLQHSCYHEWVDLLFSSVKFTSFLIATRFYPLIDFLLMQAIPRSLKEKVRAHQQQIVDKFERRINWEVTRPDLMSHVLAHGDSGKGMTREEIDVNFALLTTVGSETTATCLSGIVNYLLADPAILKARHGIGIIPSLCSDGREYTIQWYGISVLDSILLIYHHTTTQNIRRAEYHLGITIIPR